MSLSLSDLEVGLSIPSRGLNRSCGLEGRSTSGRAQEICQTWRQRNRMAIALAEVALAKVDVDEDGLKGKKAGLPH